MASHDPYGRIGPGLTRAITTPPLFLPQTSTKTLFTIAGGPIMVEAIFGIVTVVIGAVANATKLEYVSTATSTAVALDATSDINALAAGAIFSVTGTLATAAIIVSPNTNQLALDQATAWNIGAGVIRVNCAGSDGGTGKIQWYIRYRPYATFTPTNFQGGAGAGSGPPYSTIVAASS